MSGTIASAPNERWFIASGKTRDDRIPLFCFAHAGGAPGEYARWGRMTSQLDVLAVQLPGRGSRIAEQPHLQMEDVVASLAGHDAFRKPCMFFGHSFGGLLAFELSSALRDAGQTGPAHLFVSSSPPPTRVPRIEPVHTLPDDELLAWMQSKWGPLPNAVTNSPALLKSSLSTFRHDIGILSNYRHRDRPPLNCPITTFVGDKEDIEMSDWTTHTTATVDHHRMSGGHFHFREDPQPLLQIIVRITNAESLSA